MWGDHAQLVIRWDSTWVKGPWCCPAAAQLRQSSFRHARNMVCNNICPCVRIPRCCCVGGRPEVGSCALQVKLVCEECSSSLVCPPWRWHGSGWGLPRSSTRLARSWLSFPVAVFGYALCLGIYGVWARGSLVLFAHEALYAAFGAGCMWRMHVLS